MIRSCCRYYRFSIISIFFRTGLRSCHVWIIYPITGVCPAATMCSDDQRIVEGFCVLSYIVQQICKSFCCTMTVAFVFLDRNTFHGFGCCIILKIVERTFIVFFGEENQYSGIGKALLVYDTSAHAAYTGNTESPRFTT